MKKLLFIDVHVIILILIHLIHLIYIYIIMLYLNVFV